MHEIICPKCKTVIPLDEADYNAIVDKVRTDEFEAEVGRRVQEVERLHKSEEARKATETQAAHEKALAARDGEITRLKAQLEGVEEKKGLEIAQALSERDAQIIRLREQLQGAEEKKNLEIANLRLEEQRRSGEALARKDDELQKQREALLKARSDAEQQKRAAQDHERALTEQHRLELEAKDKEVAFYRDFKAKRSVKLLGEDLEQHCYALYNQMLLPVMPGATFEKDNESVREEGESSGTKGDFIFRLKEDGVEVVSIMFEMKNEGDVSSTKHRNADFYAKLDSDRKKKGCEYAVLVSMLELDNEGLSGINVVNGYEKMFMVRPDQFIPIITLLVQAGKNSLEAKKQLVAARSQSVDITHFEEQLETFKDGFARNFDLASRQFQKAIDEINATIKHLENVRDNLTKSQNNLRLANDKADDLTIRKLTYKNPTMKAAFEEARAKKAAEDGPDEQ